MLAIVGGKGGCGKTTTALGLARAFAAAGDRPTVVDADREMPNLHTRADVARTPGIDAVGAGGSIDRARHHSAAFPRVHVVPAGRTTDPPGRRTLDRLACLPDPVIVDCPAGATEGTAGPVRVADRALVVSTATEQGLADGIKTAELVRALGTDLAGAVVTRVEGDPAFDRSPFGPDCPVIGTVPAVDGDPLRSEVGRASYARATRTVSERNL